MSRGAPRRSYTHKWQLDEVDALTAWFESIDVDRDGVITNKEATDAGLDGLLQQYDIDQMQNKREETKNFLELLKDQKKKGLLKKEYRRATHDYTGAKEHNQIDLRKDDIVYIQSHHERGWLRGRVVRKSGDLYTAVEDSELGYFPQSYTEDTTPPVRLDKAPIPSAAMIAKKPDLLKAVFKTIDEKDGSKAIHEWANAHNGEAGKVLITLITQASQDAKKLKVGIQASHLLLKLFKSTNPKEQKESLLPVMSVNKPWTPFTAAVAGTPILGAAAMAQSPEIFENVLRVGLEILLYAPPGTIAKASAATYVERLATESFLQTQENSSDKKAELARVCLTGLMLFVHYSEQKEEPLIKVLEGKSKKSVGIMVLLTLLTGDHDIQISLCEAVIEFVKALENTPEYKNQNKETSTATDPRALARCLKRVCQWPGNSSTPSKSGPHFISILGKCNGDPEAKEFLKEIISEFFLVEGDLKICITPEDLKPNDSKTVGENLEKLLKQLRSTNLLGWEKAIRMSGESKHSLIPTLISVLLKRTQSHAFSVLAGLIDKSPEITVSLIGNSAPSILDYITKDLPMFVQGLGKMKGEFKEEMKKKVCMRVEAMAHIIGRSSKKELSPFFKDKARKDKLVEVLGDLIQFQYPSLVRLIAKTLILAQYKDPLKTIIARMTTHKRTGFLSEAVCKCFLRPEKSTELAVIRFIQEVFDSGFAGFFAMSDIKMLFQMLVQKLQELVNFPSDPVVAAFLKTYRSMLGWEAYPAEKPYNSQGESVLEDLLNEIEDKASPLAIQASTIMNILRRYE
ncbi:hypothetical protein AAMO2058_001064600 [Amorphochlora amoebiformis]